MEVPVDTTKSSADRRIEQPEVAAGDPFIAAGRHLDCAGCFGGYVTITVEEDGQEHDEAVPCRRCAAGVQIGSG
jgi:hypothetical protein